jgi:hypothetical protein
MLLYFGRSYRPLWNANATPDFFSLRGMKIKRSVNFPFKDNLKLYTSNRGESDSAAHSFPESYVVQAANSLLRAANIPLYAAKAIGELKQTPVRHVMTDESAELRAKLKTLAIASSTIIKFNSVDYELRVIPLEKETQKTAAQIPLNCLALEGNMYSFSMQTSMKDQIYSGLEILYGKNIATGKYERRILVTENGIEHDEDESSLPITNLEWDKLFSRLAKNSNNGINNLASIENEWITNREGAERAAYTYLSWCCSPLYAAQIKCVRQLLPSEVDIGEFVKLKLPNYPAKMENTTWMVTAISDDLDSPITTISLLETWNAKESPKGYLLTENRDFLNLENDNHIKLEESAWRKD